MEKMKNVILIVNPVSGKLKGKAALFGVIEALSANDVVPTVLLTKGRGDAVRLAREAAGLYAEGRCDAVLCCGGDGTLNEVLTGLREAHSKMPVGYIPAGTTNDFANGLGLPLDPPEAARQIAENLNREKLLNFDLGRFGAERYFSYIASFGAFSSPSYTTPQSVKNNLGYLAYVLSGVNDFFKIKPIRTVCTTSEGKRIISDLAFGAVSNTRSVGGVVKLGEDEVDMSDGLFEVVLVTMPKDPAELSQIAMAVMQSDLHNSKLIKFFRTRHLTFEMPKGTPWTLDGEKAICPGKVTVTNIPRAANLVLDIKK